ncbi:MAG: hypothetical protein DRJ01_10680, partial [Bacteroidetes bacterium]
MKKIVFFLFLLLVLINLNAETVIPSGNVSGVWSISGSPYLIDGDIAIPADSTLTIDPGVIVEFQDLYIFDIQGTLKAEGTVNDSIFFTVPDSLQVTGWLGINFIGEETSRDSSKMVYCDIQYINKIEPRRFITSFDGSINIKYYTALLIDHCYICNNKSNDGGAIFIEDSDPIISNCEISNNYAFIEGGAIKIYNDSAPEISNNSICYNISEGKGGAIKIGCGNPSPLIQNNVINHNTALDGGGLLIGGNEEGGEKNRSNTTLINNFICYNTASERNGGGIKCAGFSHTTMIGNVICNNIASTSGGGVQIAYYAAGEMINNTIADNEAMDGGGIAVG